MNRQILVGMVSLALTGCAQLWPAAPPVARNGSRLPPVGLTPLPNIYEALNRENPRFDPAAFRPENGPVLADMGVLPFVGGGINGAQGGVGNPTPCVTCRPDPAPCPAPGPVPAPRVAALAPNRPPVHMRGASPGPVLAAAPRSPLPPAAAPSVAALAPPAPVPMPAPETFPAAAPLAAAATPPETEVTQTSTAPVEAPPVSSPAPAAGPEPSPSVLPEAVPAPGPGPLPAAEPAPPSLPPASEGTATGADPGPAAPSAAVPLEPAPASTALPLELPPLPPPEAEAKDPPGAVPTPAPAASPPAAGTSALDPAPAPPGAGATAAVPVKVDPEVVKTAADPAALHAEGSPVKLTEAGHVAARVGDEVITLKELTEAIKERKEKLPPDYKMSVQEVKYLTSQVLDILIEKSIILQEAKRELKKPELLRQFNTIADKAWREEELPPLLRQMGVENEFKLKDKLAEKGKSLERMREAYRQEFLARGFMEQKLKGKISVTYSEMREYYNAHLDDYLQHEQWTWREVIVELDKHPSRAAARSKAEAVLARLRRGDDFAQVAQAESEGPNRTKGGLWETAPDSYAVEAVNGALRSLPIGQVSAIIEGPASYHIVRVDARRPAGPASFAEVQDKIRRIVFRRKAEHEQGSFLDKLRQQTVVTTVFDRTDFAPSASRAGPTADPAVTPASASSPTR